MENDTVAFVLIHGAWHNSTCWQPLMEHVARSGYETYAIDLPGAGVHSVNPTSYSNPVDGTVFAREPTPNSGVTQEQRTNAIVELINGIRKSTDRPIVLVGHSMGGLTVTAVAEAIPEQLEAIVYVTGFMLAPSVTLSEFHRHPANSSSVLRTLIAAPPAEIGAQRINFRSNDKTFYDRMKLAFAADIEDSDFAAHIANLHCDEPNSVTLLPSPMTFERFGKVPRHYIRCLQDRGLPPEAQTVLIREVDAAMENHTVVHELHSSHLPMVSQPQALAQLLDSIAAERLKKNSSRNI
ncbi:alpha/beta fold hydrolase [Granulicella sp. dw_53]|uniref:alpha/beta fold hydrolase n=1 Tax=Granulicella sp. dw_53 TaxID=2719792 RepID=UPI001BD39865|nr:alpha/beta fold hydrolase [Granulicella sp. dw_53]